MKKWVWELNDIYFSHGKCMCSLHRKGVQLLFNKIEESETKYRLYSDDHYIGNISKIWNRIEGSCSCLEEVE